MLNIFQDNFIKFFHMYKIIQNQINKATKANKAKEIYKVEELLSSSI